MIISSINKDLIPKILIVEQH